MKLIFVLPALGFVCAAAPALADADPDLGTAVRAVERAQIIDLNPQYRGDPAPGSDGAKAVRAMLRYRLDREKPLISPTSDTKSGAQGTPVNGSGETQNGSQIPAGVSPTGQGQNGQGPGSMSAPGYSGSGAAMGGPVTSR